MSVRAFVFRSDDLTLEGEIVVPPSPRAVVIFAHGIPAGTAPDPADPGYAGFARTLATRAYAAAWFNFRGCRGAPGEFSLQGWCTDLSRALDAVSSLADVAALPRILVGSSAGGMASIYVAAQRDDVDAVATLAAPSSLSFGGLAEDPAALIQRFRNSGIIHDPAFPPDVDAWMSEFAELAAERSIGAVAPRPILLVHGEADDVVPYPHAERLFDLAGEPKELVRIPRGGHQLRKDPRAVDALTDWLDRHSSRSISGQSGRRGYAQ